jgi:tripartite-type tricarboxylate transporter receptor subunit TctC
MASESIVGAMCCRCAAAVVFVALLLLPSDARSDRADALRFIVGGSVGSTPDLIARRLSDGLSAALGRPVAVLNRPGASGMIAMEAVARAKPDGATIGLANMSQLVFNTYLFRDLRYDPIRDLAPIATLAMTPMVIAAHPRFEARSFPALINLAKAKPGELRFATAGVGSPPRIVLAVIMDATGTRFDGVPFKSDTDALRSVLSGEVPLLIAAASFASPHIKSGELQGIASTGHTRIASLPYVPTVAESGYPSIGVETWLGVVAPAGTAPHVVEQLNDAINRIISAPDFMASTEAVGSRILRTSPQQFAQLIREAHTRWGPALRSPLPGIP